MTVSVVTPWVGHRELAPDYFAALGTETVNDLVIVDNGSTPPLEFAQIRLNEIAGFARACNTGLAAAKSDVVVFLNNDIAATKPGWLSPLVDAVEPGILTGAKLRYDRHGDVDGQHFPYLDGWCLAGTRTDLLNLGGFDESLMEPAYYSDNLLCLRARGAGMTLREVPTGLRHKLNQTTGGASNPAVREATVVNYRIYADEARRLTSPVEGRRA